MKFDKIRERAIQKYGSEEKADAFMEGFAKEASLWDHAIEQPGAGQNARAPKTVGMNIMDNMSGAIGKGVGNALLNSAVLGVGRIVNGVKGLVRYEDFLQAVEKAIASNKILKGADRNKVLAYAETIYKFAPHVALDPNMLSSVLANAVHGEGIDPMTIRTLTELEGRYQDNTQFLPKNFN